MATNLPSCFLIQFLKQLLMFPVNLTLFKYVKSRRNYGFLITKELIFGFQILDLKPHFFASRVCTERIWNNQYGENGVRRLYSNYKKRRACVECSPNQPRKLHLRTFYRATDETFKIPVKFSSFPYHNFTRVLQFSSISPC